MILLSNNLRNYMPIPDHYVIRVNLAWTFSLDDLIEKGRKSQFDMAFIDANKKDYDAYYERVLSLIRPGGLIVIDNVFWGGRVLDRNNLEKSTRSIGNLNKKLKNDERISLSMLPLNDGVSLAWKRP